MRAKAVLALVLIAGSAIAWRAFGSEIEGFPLTTPVRQSLGRVHESWQAWQRAYFQNDRETADDALQDLLAVGQQLGLERLSDLGIAAAVYAVRSAEEGELERARLALDAASALDPERPEVALARAVIRRHEGDYLRSVLDLVLGFAQVVKQEARRIFLYHNLFLWGLGALLLAGALFIIVQMAAKGVDLLHDLFRMISPPLPSTAAWVVIVVILLAPLALPSGVLWLLALWALLLWGQGSPSERIVLALVTITVGTAPLILRVQQREAQLLFVPPLRALAALEDGRLYGKLFTDLKVLRSALPEHPAVIEVEADLHRRLQQWELAQVRYRELLEQEPGHPTALNNLGVYYFGRQDFGSAITYFENATEADSRLVEAFYNLNLAYSQSYAFGDARQALAGAKEIDGDRVDRWLEADPPGTAIPVEGSLRRYDEIRRALRATWSRERAASAFTQLREDTTTLVMVIYFLLVVALYLIRRRFGYGDHEREERDDTPARLRRALIPGYASARRGHGWRSLGGILLPVALLMTTLPIGWTAGYRPLVGYAPEAWLPMTIGVSLLLLLVLVRIGRELTTEG